MGNQPYGLLPVTARGFVPDPASALERELLEAIGWFRNIWEAALPRVPTMRDPSAESLHQVLAMQPWSVAKRFWQVAGPAQIENYPDIQDHAFSQRLLVQFLLADPAGAVLLIGRPQLTVLERERAIAAVKRSARAVIPQDLARAMARGE